MTTLNPIHADRWLALANRSAQWQDEEEGEINYRFHTVDCGELWLKSGRLVPCDPFVTLAHADNVEIAVPPGRYPVRATIADVSDEQDGSHEREAYLSLVLSDVPAVGWRFLAPLQPGDTAPEAEEDEFVGIPVDAGTVGFVDADAVARLMPDPASTDWYETLVDSGGDDSWFAQMDDETRLRAGCANIALPGASDGENLILAHSGWGDGIYAVIGTYAADGALTGVHIDLAVVPAALLPEWD
ncbi:hypothetical protein IGB42_03894 [Andreprevotia sp. IGB-42]|uniref:DUF4241 domain-containing protein n=1 Tax=Andreprevotia sp. IGB-42 TaxID=2497473 RepID=UPI00135A21AC|nr:DUF4241 domain-containing protein [Andreprevotia sp. IGB-42]KAF0811605.1 hypothetical protein IGB42_03894 [Andreprevotia sp. IGB-42]